MPARRRDQHGVSLVEVLVVIAVLIPVVLAATLGLLTSARLATNTKASQELNAAAASFAESLKEIDYVDCAAADGYDGATGLWEPPADANITIDVRTVEYWKQASTDYVLLGDSSCSAGPPVDEGAQRITIELATLDSTTELSVVKRDPAGYPDTAP